MSKKDMLGPTIRALVGVPQERLALIADIANRFSSETGDLWHGKIASAIQEGLETSTSADNIIRVDRSIRPAYPDWVKDVLHPELECTGPAEFDLAKVESWLHDGQKNGKWIKGEKIYEHLKSATMLESCFNLADLLAIQARGVQTFREHFADKAVFAWKSVVRDRYGDLSVPYLYLGGDQVVLGWNWLVDVWNDSDPALRFASQN